MKLIIGFALGLCASAFAKDLEGVATHSFSGAPTIIATAHLLGGVDPNGSAQIIQVDSKGYAICSKEQPKP